MISKLMLNSLYGRFGLSPYLSEYVLSDDITDIHDSNFIQLDPGPEGENKFLVELPNLKNQYASYKINQNEAGPFGPCEAVPPAGRYALRNAGRNGQYNLANISLPMAMFVTAYARIYMSKYKIKYQNNLYYSDTDSIILDKPLPANIVSNTELGKFKLEYEIQEAIFLAPKVYAFITKSGDYICKIKGSKHKIDFNIMKDLLVKDSSYDINQSK